VTQITLNRPERVNALAFAAMAPLDEALKGVSFDTARAG
jgi:enoyl-CoA hydratase/carnithine racemase